MNITKILKFTGKVVAAPVTIPVHAVEKSMKSIIEQQIMGVLRHVLTAAGGAAVTAGVIDGSQLSIVVGALIAIAGVVMSVVEKKLRIA